MEEEWLGVREEVTWEVREAVAVLRGVGSPNLGLLSLSGS